MKRYLKRTRQYDVYRECEAYRAALRTRYGDWLAERLVWEHRRGWYVLTLPLWPNGQAPDLGIPCRIRGLTAVYTLRRKDLTAAREELETRAATHS